MWLEIFLGSVLVLGTTMLHALGTVAALSFLKKMYRPWTTHVGRALMISGLVVGMFLVSVLDSTLWAYTYLGIGAIPDIETALYFSMVTFTTLGYGDVALGPDWRLLASFEAANGTIMFGWTTALVVAYMQKLAPSRSDDD
jgi:hypothetical protein